MATIAEPSQTHTRAVAALPAAIAIIAPTFNEQANVPLLIERLDKAMAGLAWEVVFVDDDSTDGTLAALSRASARHLEVAWRIWTAC